MSSCSYSRWCAPTRAHRNSRSPTARIRSDVAPAPYAREHGHHPSPRRRRSLSVHRVRVDDAQVGGPLRRVPAMGHRRRVRRAERHRAHRRAGGAEPRAKGAADHGGRRRRHPAAHHRRGRVRPGAGRRHRAGSGDPPVRRAGRRQVHPAPRGRGAERTCRSPRAVRERRGVRRTGAPARRAHRSPARRAVPRQRDRSRDDPRPCRRRAAEPADRRLGADGLVRSVGGHGGAPESGA